MQKITVDRTVRINETTELEAGDVIMYKEAFGLVDPQHLGNHINGKTVEDVSLFNTRGGQVISIRFTDGTSCDVGGFKFTSVTT